MNIQVILTPSLESLKKDSVYSKLDEVTREYLRKSKWKVLRDNFHITPSDIRSLCDNAKNGVLTDIEFEKLKIFIPEYYLYIDPGKDEEWIHNKTILHIMNKFNIVGVNTSQMKKDAVDTFVENVIKSGMYEKVSNVYDYSHITFARSFEPGQMPVSYLP